MSLVEIVKHQSFINYYIIKAITWEGSICSGVIYNNIDIKKSTVEVAILFDCIKRPKDIFERALEQLYLLSNFTCEELIIAL